MFSREKPTTTISSPGDSKGTWARAFFSGYKFMKVDLPNNVKIPRTTRASFLPPFPLPPSPPADCFRSPIDRSFFLPLHCAHEAPFYKKKKLAAFLPRATWLVAFFSFAAGSPIFFPLVFPESWIRTPSVHDGSSVQRPAWPRSPIRVTNSPLFFLRAHSFFLLLHLLPLPLFSFLFVRWLARRPSYNAEKKNFIENLLNGTTETGPGVTYNGFPSCPAGQLKRAGPRIR